MSMIEYQTEGKVQINCALGNSKPCAFSWRRGDIAVDLFSGGAKIELSKSQLLQIARLAHTIAADLEPAVAAMPAAK